jgi:hypothetical protein
MVRRGVSKMGMRTVVVVGLACSILSTATLWAAEPRASDVPAWIQDLTLTVSERARGEFVDWFEPKPGTSAAGAQRYDFFGNQFRLGVRLDVPHLVFFVEGQHTQIDNLPSDASLTRANGGNLGPGAIYFANAHQGNQGEPFLKQGYCTLKELPGMKGFAFTGGRFEYGDGLETVPADPALAWVKRVRIGERLVGPFGYTDVTRSVDGVRGVYDADAFNVTAIGTRPTQGGFEISANRELDVWLAGLAVTLKKIQNLVPVDARLFYLYYRDNRDQTTIADNRLTLKPAPKDHDPISLHTFGAHAITVVDAGPGKVDGLLWGALQSGDWGQQSDFGWAYAIETGYQLPQLFAAPWLRVGYDRSSGDGDPTDGSHKTFFQILPTARIYAQTPFYNLMNSGDLFTQVILKPHSKVTVRTDYHWLQLTESKDLWYSGGGATNDTFFGYQGLNSGGQHNLADFLDTSVTVSILKQLTAYAYYGHVFGQSVVKSTFAGANANYGYLELTYRY